jgi:hypothetical protein
MPRYDVLVECFRINQVPDDSPEARPQAERIIAAAYSAVADPHQPMTGRERFFLKKADASFSAGHFYEACLTVAEAMREE